MEKLLIAQELSDILQVKLSTIRKWCHYGYVPYLRIGGFARFKEKKIEEWLKKRERQGRTAYKKGID
ncbi:MAG: helix-turn-helix domain-containing protein [Candidatus Omnitrophota bacterium]